MKAAGRWVAVLLVFFSLNMSAVALEPTENSPDYIIITEVQTASLASASEEFVELYNPTDFPVEIEDWQLQYKSATGTEWIAKSTLSGQIEPRGYLLLSTEGYLDEHNGQTIGSGLAASGGHVRVVQVSDDSDEEVVFDLLGWGTADTPEVMAAEAPAAGESLKRKVNEETLEYIDSNDNSMDFWVSSEPNPEHTPPPEIEEAPPQEELDDTEVYLPIILSELLIDPDSPLTDAEDEFVELYNPNDEAVDLSGYILETGSSYSYDFVLPSIIMQPQQYLALYSVDSSLVLANSGGAARVLSPDGEEIDNTVYDSAKPDDSWSLFGENWKYSLKSTPNAPNELVEDEVPRAENSTPNSLKPCASNQFRNPETNRCKLISTGSSLKPCDADEFRNPETNRCNKKRDNTGSAGSASDANQEVLAATTEQKVSKPDFTTVALVGGAALLYSLYEFRYDIRNRFHQARGYFSDRFFRRKSP